MKTKASLKEVIFLLSSIVIVIIVAFSIINDVSKTKALEVQETEKAVDPSKDFQSLDNNITYLLPEGWQKEDQVDQESGNNTLISLSSPDYNSPETSVVASGVRIIIDRSYDPNAESTLTAKLNAPYEFYDYNIRALKVGDKNAMTMHEDYEGHNRFIYVANADHLWQISITSKNLEDEQTYEAQITTFLNSLQFKN